MKEVTTKIKETTNKEERDAYANMWKELRQSAQDEAKKIGEDIKGMRQKKTNPKKKEKRTITRGSYTST